jgi:poly-gamma-glutamate synthesis protein (capsule biosynthesis protein)
MQTENKRKLGNLLLASTGDSLISRHLSTNMEKDFLEIVKLIRNADVAFTNLETTIHDFKGYPAEESGGAWMVSPPYVADELKWAGFNLLSCANNHTMDWSHEGMFSTSEILNKVGLTHAGIGKNLADARRPAYLDTSRGRVGLISASSTFASWGRAGHARREVQGRPGLNPLRYETIYHVNEDTFKVLKNLVQDLGLVKSSTGNNPDELTFLKTTFKVGEKTKIELIANKDDFKGNIQSVKEANRQADWVIVSLHTHERGEDESTPAQFVIDFARACIDAGADVVVMHGAHLLRGIEIHKDRPIYYSLSNFIYQTRLLEKLPEDIYERNSMGCDATPADIFDLMEQRYYGSDTPHVDGGAPHLSGTTYSFLALSKFEDRKLSELRLYPVTLGPERHRIYCGYPRLATGDLGKKIIGMLATLSSPFGTQIEYEDGIGVIKLKG